LQPAGVGSTIRRFQYASSLRVAAYHRLVQEGYTNVRRYAGGIEDWESAGPAPERAGS
jgi:hypothetical protein